MWVGGLSATIDQSSLKIKASGGAVISAYEYSVDYLSEKRSVPSVRQLQDSVSFYQKKFQQIEVDTKINRHLIELLQKGTEKNVAGSEKGVSFEELTKMLDYYKSKSSNWKPSWKSTKRKPKSAKRFSDVCKRN